MAIQIIDLPVPKDNSYFTYIIISDVHDYENNPESMEVFFKFLKCIPFKNRKVILLGDILDFGFLFGKNPEFKYALKFNDYDGFFVPNFKKTYKWFNQFWGKLQAFLPKKDSLFYALGNHEYRTAKKEILSNVSQEYKHYFDIKTQLNLEKRNIVTVNYNDWFRIKVNNMVDFMLTHGQLCGANSIKKHVGLAHTSVMFGHTHEVGMESFKNINETFIGYNNACMCLKDLDYMDNKVNNWSNGFSTLTVTKNLYFVNMYTINKGVLRLPFGKKL